MAGIRAVSVQVPDWPTVSFVAIDGRRHFGASVRTSLHRQRGLPDPQEGPFKRIVGSTRVRLAVPQRAPGESGMSGVGRASCGARVDRRGVRQLLPASDTSSTFQAIRVCPDRQPFTPLPGAVAAALGSEVNAPNVRPAGTQTTIQPSWVSGRPTTSSARSLKVIV